MKFLNYLNPNPGSKLTVRISKRTMNNDEFYTSDWFMKGLLQEGEFDLDPASCYEAHMKVKISKRIYTKETNGLIQDWGDSYVFLNPPFSPEVFVPFCKKMVSHNNGILLTLDKSTTITNRLLDRNCKVKMNFGKKKAIFTRPGGGPSNFNYQISLYAFGDRAAEHLMKSKAYFESLGLDPYLMFNESAIYQQIKSYH